MLMAAEFDLRFATGELTLPVDRGWKAGQISCASRTAPSPTASGLDPLTLPTYRSRSWSVLLTLTRVAQRTSIGFVFALGDDRNKLFDGQPEDTGNTCHLDHIHGNPTDWTE